VWPGSEGLEPRPCGSRLAPSSRHARAPAVMTNHLGNGELPKAAAVTTLFTCRSLLRRLRPQHLPNRAVPS
jgi:hypothetical protein